MKYGVEYEKNGRKTKVAKGGIPYTDAVELARDLLKGGAKRAWIVSLDGFPVYTEVGSQIGERT